jgi:energy-coupling factor transport system permease protein
MTRARTHHPVAWMIWAASAGAVVLLVRNPWYLLLIAAAAIAVRWRTTGERPTPATVRVFAGLMIFPTLLNFLFSRAGETVMLEFPVRYVGGPYTLEALLFGATAGLQLACLLMLMMTFSLAVSPTDILRRIPAGLGPAGITASIGMNFAPQSRRSFEAVREAQQVRGHTPKGFRDLQSIVTPLVILSLESAMTVGEGLATRGWGSSQLSLRRRRLAWIGVGLFAAGALAWSLAPQRAALAAAMAAAGAGLLLITITRGGTRSRYRPDAWRASDTLMAGTALGVLGLMVVLVLLAPPLLAYEPYPRAAWPAFTWPLAIGASLLALPAALPGDD